MLTWYHLSIQSATAQKYASGITSKDGKNDYYHCELMNKDVLVII